MSSGIEGKEGEEMEEQFVATPYLYIEEYQENQYLVNLLNDQMMIKYTPAVAAIIAFFSRLR